MCFSSVSLATQLPGLQVIAADVAAVIIHCGSVPQPAQPGHCLPAFPDAATSNHAANDTHVLHETREFWGRLQPQSLVPLLQSASSKGKGRMPSAYLPVTSPSAGYARGHLPSTHLPIQRPSPSQSFPSEPSQNGGRTASSSYSGLQDSLLANGSTASGTRQDGSMHSSFARGVSVGGRSVHFAASLEADGSDDSDAGQAHTSDPQVNLHSSREKQAPSRVSVEARVSKRSPPVDISFRSVPTPWNLWALLPVLVLNSPFSCRSVGAVAYIHLHVALRLVRLLL